jgi:MFS family permease
MSKRASAAVAAWLLAAIYYFYQYSLRSAPSVMLPQLTDAYQLSTVGVASLVGLFYYGYSPFSLVAGAAMDRLGPRTVIPIGAFMAGIGALLFGTSNLAAANIGRFLQGAGGVFALVGAVYIATSSFPASRAATLIGATQMFGMAGGSAGQFVVGPLIGGGLAWNRFWTGMGILGLLLAVTLFVLLPRRAPAAAHDNWVSSTVSAMGAVFRNPQSILCGLIAGLFFLPTTIFGMTWGIRYLQEGRGFDYADAVSHSAMVPVGWIIGCPLLGFISDRIGRRKPVIVGGGLVLLACFAWVLYGPADVLPPYVLALLAGIASGAAMIPYTVIKEANPPQYGGTATGVINFLNFTFSAVLGPVFAGLFQITSGGPEQSALAHYQAAFRSLLFGIALAIVLASILKETGPAARAVVNTTTDGDSRMRITDSRATKSC